MRDGRAPRGFAAASIKTPGLPDGTEERFAGYGVMGLPFRSGHYRALRHFPASSIGPGFRAVWHRDPHRRWTFYADAPAEVSCARYFGATSPGGAERVPIDVTWTGPRSLRVTVPDRLSLGGGDMSTKTVISIAEIPGTLRAGMPVWLAGAR